MPRNNRRNHPPQSTLFGTTNAPSESTIARHYEPQIQSTYKESYQAFYSDNRSSLHVNNESRKGAWNSSIRMAARSGRNYPESVKSRNVMPENENEFEIKNDDLPKIKDQMKGKSQLPRGQDLSYQPKRRTEDQDLDPEDRHFDSQMQISDALNKLLIGSGRTSWMEEKLTNGCYIRYPGDISQAETPLQYLKTDKEWPEKFMKKAPSKHIVDVTIQKALHKMIKNSYKNNPTGSSYNRPELLYHDIQDLTRCHEGTLGLYKTLVRYASKTKTQEKTKITGANMLGPLKYRAMKIAQQKTDLAFKPKTRLKPLGYPEDWLEKTWKKEKILNQSAGYKFKNLKKSECLSNVKTFDNEKVDSIITNANKLYQMFLDESILDENSDLIPTCVARVGRRGLSHPSNIKTNLELIPDADYMAVGEVLFRPYYEACCGDSDHPIWVGVVAG